MTPSPGRRAVADVVARYIAHADQVYTSREPSNIRSALALFVQLVDNLDAASIRRGLRELEADARRSPGYRRKVWAYWLRFLRWAVEFEHVRATTLVRCQTFRPRFTSPEADEPETFPSATSRSVRGFATSAAGVDVSAIGAPATPAALTRPAPGRGARSAFRFPEDAEAFAATVRATLPFLSPLARDFVLLLVLTGARPDELLRIRFAFIEHTSTSGAWLRLDRHKTARHRPGSPRRIFLPQPALNILDRHWKPLLPDEWAFPRAKDPRQHRSTDSIAQLLRRCLATCTFLRRWTLGPLASSQCSSTAAFGSLSLWRSKNEISNSATGLAG